MIAALPPRMTRRIDFLKARSGHKFHYPAFVIQARRFEEANMARIGFSITKKVGNAVERNRIKRRLRAAIVDCRFSSCAQSGDYVFFARRTALWRNYSALVKDIESCANGRFPPPRAKRGHGPKKRPSQR